jgi:predicted O-methyltransferase YrrM
MTREEQRVSSLGAALTDAFAERDAARALAAASRGRLDALRLSRNDHRFVPTRVRPIWMRAKYQLLPAWSDYVANVSTVDWAVSLESATYLLWLIRGMRPVYLLDTGSGFSSYVFRRYQQEEREHRVVVVSVDDSPEWLETTREFLRDHELSTDELMTLAEFEERADKAFDFVFHDLAGEGLRVTMLPHLLSAVRPDAPIVVDDAHFENVLRGARNALRGTRRQLYSLRNYTLDELGRFALLLSPSVARKASAFPAGG